MDRGSGFLRFCGRRLFRLCLFHFRPALRNSLPALFLFFPAPLCSGGSGLCHAGCKVTHALRHLRFPVVKGVFCIDGQILCLFFQPCGGVYNLAFGVHDRTCRLSSTFAKRSLFFCAALSVWSGMVCLCSSGSSRTGSRTRLLRSLRNGCTSPKSRHRTPQLVL